MKTPTMARWSSVSAYAFARVFSLYRWFSRTNAAVLTWRRMTRVGVDCNRISKHVTHILCHDRGDV